MNIYESHDHTMLSLRKIAIFGENNLFDPSDPIVTYDPTIVSVRVAVKVLVI